MKKLAILGLVSAVVLASATDAFAQFRGRNWGRNQGRGWDGGYAPSYYQDGYAPGNYIPSNTYYGNYNPSNTYYGEPAPYNNFSPGYYSSPDYVYSNSMNAAQGRSSFYMEPNTAVVTVTLPREDAQVWFDSSATQQRGMERTFGTPALQQAGTYTVKARWMENGRPVERQRSVRVQPGQAVRVDFRNDNNNNGNNNDNNRTNLNNDPNNSINNNNRQQNGVPTNNDTPRTDGVPRSNDTPRTDGVPRNNNNTPRPNDVPKTNDR